MTAAAPMTIMMGSGVLNCLISKDNLIRADMIPVDMVSNNIIVGTAR